MLNWNLRPRAVGSTSLGALALLAASCVTQTGPIEVLAELKTRPANPAVTLDGRILFSQHPLDDPELKVVELTEEGEVIPFPSLSWSRDRLGAVIGLEARSNGLVWILDMGGGGISPKLVAWDAVNNSLAHQIQIPDSVRVPSSFLQDMAILERYGVVVIADMTLPGPFATPEPAFVVVDIETGRSWRVLQGDPSFMPTVGEIHVEGTRLEALTDGGDVRPHRMGLNAISADPAQDWLYYGSVSGDRVHRIPGAALANQDLTAEELRESIEDYAAKPPSDGFRVDGQGRVFVTDLEGNGVGIATPDGYELVESDAIRLRWPDGLAFDRTGAVIVTANQLHRHPELNGGEDESDPPYAILRLNRLRALK
jgi:sugar lactone lactonase YvrE